jgi:phosphate transport system protein
VDALRAGDRDSAQEIEAADIRINRKRFEIENRCLTLIATQQPMARDLRSLAAILEINTELERIGDYAKGIAHINRMLDVRPWQGTAATLSRMAELGLGMLHRALTAFIEKDVATARQIPEEDDQVDALYNHIYNEMLQTMIAHPDLIDDANYLIWAAHNLERLADRVTNICERIVFAATGEMRELDVSDDEKVSH